MAIDPQTERLYSLRTAATRFVPPDNRGRPCHPDRLWRAIRAGRLEGLRYGKSWFTSEEAIARWAQGMADRAVTGHESAPPPRRSPAQKQRAIARARRDLKRMGL
jgi:hypothetical protein